MSSLNKYGIVPASISYIKHRNECLPYYNCYWNDDCGAYAGGNLPIFVAPMSCITNCSNIADFENNGFVPIIPRNIDLETRLKKSLDGWWSAFGLEEFIQEFLKKDVKSDFPLSVCIDVANGHMESLISACKDAKDKYGEDIEIMTGNIANPDTYLSYARAGIDYCRIGIGGGTVCDTSNICGVHYPMADLIKECYQIKSHYNCVTKIVADGGINRIGHIPVALALGADYVMCGSLIAKCKESCGDRRFKLGQEQTLYYGMSTERAQKEMYGKVIRVSEGVEKWLNVEYSAKELSDLINHSLKTAMSYTNKKSLEEFVGKVRTKEQPIEEYLAYKK